MNGETFYERIEALHRMFTTGRENEIQFAYGVMMALNVEKKRLDAQRLDSLLEAQKRISVAIQLKGNEFDRAQTEISVAMQQLSMAQDLTKEISKK
jgi:hypothetical protein